jgi:N-acetylmuramoyl-L-alanine amidase
VRYHTLHLAQRLAAAITVVVLLCITLVVARVAGYEVPLLNRFIPQGLVGAAFARNVALISGHAGNDSGAVCTDEAGNVLVTEAEVNAAVAERVGQQLRRAGADVLILAEFDPRLAGLHADLLLSLHADSCIDASGYKAASSPLSPVRLSDDRLVQCIDRHYPAVTGLTYHANTVTHDMTNYHAFRTIDPQTPSAIIELGFLGGDQELLVNEQERVAQGVTDSILCFLEAESEEDNATTNP